MQSALCPFTKVEVQLPFSHCSNAPKFQAHKKNTATYMWPKEHHLKNVLWSVYEAIQKVGLLFSMPGSMQLGVTNQNLFTIHSLNPLEIK